MEIPLEKPLDLASTLESGQAFRWRREGQWHYGVIGSSLIRVRQKLLALEYFSAPQPEEVVAPVLEDYLRLGDDLEEVYRQIRRDRRIEEAIALYQGLRLVRQDPWECLVSFICSANSNIPRIGQMLEALARRFGEPIQLGGYTGYTFPGPEKLAGAGEEELRKLGIGFRAKYLARTSATIAEKGGGELPNLRTKPYDEGKKFLMELPGVGDKVADCVLLFSLDKLEAFPVDRWVLRELQEWYLGGRKVNYRDVHVWAVDYFGPYAGYAQQYLFHRRRMDGRVLGKG